MRHPSFDIYRKGCQRVALGLLFLLAIHSCPAQDRGRLPDSVNTTEDSAAPATDKFSTTTIDSSAARTDSTRTDSSAQQPEVAVLRTVPDSDISALKKDKAFAYANDPAYWMKEPPQEPSSFELFLARLFSSAGFKYTIYGILAGLLLFVLYKIITENKLYLFYKAPRKIKDGYGQGNEKDLLEVDLDKHIQEALKAGDHRTATRYLFLKTLRLLDGSALIRYQVKSTNEDYILQMSGHPQGSDFRQLARAYEHVWYGDFLLSAQQGERLVQHFREFYKTIIPSN